MRTQLYELVVYLLLGAGAMGAATGDSLSQVLGRMDKAAGDFKSMTAQVTYVTHTDVLNEDDKETGSMTMKKVQPGEVQSLVDFTSPDRKTITIEQRRIEEYLPKLKTVQIFDLAKHGKQVDEFIMMGFGTSGTELAKHWDVTVLGIENSQGQSGIHLQLLPKDADYKQYVKSIELWIPPQGDPYPFHEKILEPSGDYRLVTYTDLKINPALPADALKFKLPPGVQTVTPGK